MRFYKQVINPTGNLSDYSVRLSDTELYSPLGQHGECAVEYWDMCEEISREQYVEATKGVYTPQEYVIA